MAASTTTRSTPSPPSGCATLPLPGISLPATSTSAPSSMSRPTTYGATASAISSPASAAGPMRCALLAGPTIGPSGPAPVPVSRFRARDSARAMPTSDTSGPLFTASSPSAVLQRSLESRLVARLAANGSPEYVLTWRWQDMPSGPPICQLRASARRTSGGGCSGWPTPDASAMNVGEDPEKRAARISVLKARRINGNGAGLTLGAAAALSGWPTPKQSDGTGPRTLEQLAARRERAMAKGINPPGESDLRDKAQLAGWPTPTQADSHGHDGEYPATATHHACQPLATTAGWATPAARDHRHPNAKSYQERGGSTKGEQLPNQVAHSGPTPNGSPASMARRGALNPAFSLWLMGYPAAWESCAPAATRSSRKSRPNSSPPSATSRPREMGAEMASLPGGPLAATAAAAERA